MVAASKQHPGCLGNSTSFPINIHLGTLAVGLGCFPLTTDLSTRSLTPEGKYLHSSLTEFGNPGRTPSPISALLQYSYLEASPKAIFGENQLFPSSIGISPLPTPHPRTFNVRGFGPPVRVTAPSPWTW